MEGLYDKKMSPDVYPSVILLDPLAILYSANTELITFIVFSRNVFVFTVNFLIYMYATNKKEKSSGVKSTTFPFELQYIYSCTVTIMMYYFTQVFPFYATLNLANIVLFFFSLVTGYFADSDY